MASDKVKQLNIWKSAHGWLAKVSSAYKDQGNSSASMTQLASQAILSIPMPNGNGHEPAGLSLGYYPDGAPVDPARIGAGEEKKD